ncbi:MAG: DUF5320 domain-containing protein [Deltaproteobacteria bacterium]|nr:DUF5320 domain-containing protein [Deltaproteobacteria bacterium]
MPGFDGTGPRGLGPMTGWGRGFCVVPLSPTSPTYIGRSYPPYGVPFGARSSTAGAVPFAPQMTREQELDFLNNQAQALRGQLEQIETRIQQLESES